MLKTSTLEKLVKISKSSSIFTKLTAFFIIIGTSTNSPILQTEPPLILNIEYLNSILLTGDVRYFKNYENMCKSQMDYDYCLENSAWLGRTRLVNYLMTKTENSTSLQSSLLFAVWRGHTDVVEAILNEHFEMQSFGNYKKGKR